MVGDEESQEGAMEAETTEQHLDIQPNDGVCQADRSGRIF